MSEENINPETAMTTSGPQVLQSSIENTPQNVTVAPVPPQPDFVAENADEMTEAHNGLLDWCRKKVDYERNECTELLKAYEHARDHKWQSGTLKRQHERAEKTVEFYEKMLAALEAGYCIVPNFPVQVFAIRRKEKKPSAFYEVSEYSRSFNQLAKPGPVGSGDYKNPSPIVLEGPAQKEKTEGGRERTVRQRWADAWQAIEFPFAMARVKIMEATTKAMRMKIFDELGMCRETEARCGDPVIVGRIVRRRGGYSGNQVVSFIIGWRIDTRDL